MSAKYDKLKSLLKELFQLDQPDLDFGLYRIMHAKSAEVTQFLDADLLPQVRQAFALYKSSDKAELEKELAKVVAGIEAAGMDPKGSPKVKELEARIKSEAVDVAALESEVYDHLYSFFRRYYSDGDFLSKRVYKPGVYAIPYEGEEVKLHWANADQYYIKTSEYLRDYAFRLRPDDDAKPMRVHFRLVDASEGEHGNVKAVEGKERRFKLSEDAPLAVEGGELVVRFTYQSDPAKQKELNAAAEAALLANSDAQFAEWIRELARLSPTEADPKRTVLAKHLKGYSDRNTFDYFIHKDLGAFLRRELDFYIKNEVMHLDDIESESAPRVEQYLSKLKVLRRIAAKIIDFLAQLEDFQKKLWLKKKFVVETSWCVRLGVVPDEFLAEIGANDAQREEWVKLCAIDEVKGDLASPGYSVPLSQEFLKAHSTLMLDTRHFSPEFTARLLDALGDLDEQADGVLFHSENFQALELMQTRYREQVKCIYIDPPYNTGSDGFSYQDNYQHSTWLSSVIDRCALLRILLRKDGALFGSIDDREVQSFRWLLDDVFGPAAFVSDIAVINNWKGRQDREHIATSHEHLLLYEMPGFESFGLSLSEAQLADYNEEDDAGERYQLRDLRKRGGADTRAERPNLYFPIYWQSGSGTAALERRSPDDIEVFPVRSDGVDGCWRWKPTTVGENLDIIEAHHVAGSNRWNVSYRVYLETSGEVRTSKPKSVWAGTKYSTDRAIKTLRSLLPGTHFKSPKAVGFVEDVVQHSTCDDEIIVDAFAGSGTTAHAAVCANRSDGGERAVVLVDQSDDFDTVLLPRLKKVTYTPEWKDGKPKRFATPEEAERSPRIFKVVRLESYEDALNNLWARRTKAQEALLFSLEAKGDDGLREQYMLRYMLDVETRGSQSLLNVAAFADPTAYTLKVKRPGSDESRVVAVDLVETFNWLIGIRVKHFAAPQSFQAGFERDSEGRLRLKGRLKEDAAGPYWFRTVTGTLPDGRKALVIWRKLTGEPEQDNLVLDEWFTKQRYSAKDSEFDAIWVNGGNNLENLKTPDDRWKVNLIEEDFQRLMFAAEGA
jgi:adenine-specific DNA-methyltransferase